MGHGFQSTIIAALAGWLRLCSSLQESIGWGRDRDFWEYMSMVAGLGYDATTFTLSMSLESESEFRRVACTLSIAYKLKDDPGLNCAEVSISQSQPHILNRVSLSALPRSHHNGKTPLTGCCEWGSHHFMHCFLDA